MTWNGSITSTEADGAETAARLRLSDALHETALRSEAARLALKALVLDGGELARGV